MDNNRLQPAGGGGGGGAGLTTHGDVILISAVAIITQRNKCTFNLSTVCQRDGNESGVLMRAFAGHVSFMREKQG